MNIGFDLDSVISQTHEHMVAVLKSKGKIPSDFTVADIKCWALEYNGETGEGIPGLTRQDLDEVFITPDFWRTIPAIQNTVDMMKKLHRSANIFIITDRRWFPELAQITKDWLDDHDVPYDNVIISKGSEKYKYCVENRIRFFIDDNESNIQSVAPYVQCAYLHAMPWNSESSLPINAVRPQCIEETLEDILTYVRIDSLAHSVKMAASSTLLHDKANGLTRTPRQTMGDTTIWSTQHAA